MLGYKIIEDGTATVPDVADAPSGAKTSSAVNEFFKGLGELAVAGSTAYQNIKGPKVVERPAVPSAPTLNVTTGTPWYKQAWVIPAAIVGGVLLIVAIFRR